MDKNKNTLLLVKEPKPFSVFMRGHVLGPFSRSLSGQMTKEELSFFNDVALKQFAVEHLGV